MITVYHVLRICSVPDTALSMLQLNSVHSFLKWTSLSQLTEEASCSPGRSSDFLKIMTLINEVKDVSRRGLMLPSILALLVTFLVTTTLCLAEATQGGKGLFG